MDLYDGDKRIQGNKKFDGCCVSTEVFCVGHTFSQVRELA